TDFRAVSWEFVFGDRPFFPVPGFERYVAPPDTSFPNASYERAQRIAEQMDRNGVDRLDWARETTRAAGLELIISQRMSCTSQPPFDGFWPSGFNRGDYSEYGRHANGAPVARFSYAKRSVQDRMIKIWSAAAKYGVDGIH